MIVDDEENILKAIKRIIAHSKDWNVEAYTNAEDALSRVLDKKFDLYLSDYKMPNIDGITFLTAVKNIQPDSMRLILSGYADLDALMTAINQAEIFRFITKPWNDDYLLSSLEQALVYHDALMENKMLADQVRKQKKLLDKHNRILAEYKTKHPDIFTVEWADDGSISIDDEII
ncbi:MAG: response regulator [Gammaproteobacteria bacterium]